MTHSPTGRDCSKLARIREKVEKLRLTEKPERIDDFTLAINWSNPRYNQAIDDVLAIIDREVKK